MTAKLIRMKVYLKSNVVLKHYSLLPEEIKLSFLGGKSLGDTLSNPL